MTGVMIEQLDYRNPRQQRIIKACLESWFRNPKDLNLTAPQLRYPFDFQKWLHSAYLHPETLSFILKKDDWIRGHAGLQFHPKEKRAHLFHLIIDSAHRRKGYARALVDRIEQVARERESARITLKVLPKNTAAVHMYTKAGFSIYDNRRGGSLLMHKSL